MLSLSVPDEWIYEVDDKLKSSTTEATSAAVRLAKAVQRTQGRTAAAQRNSLIPSSIPKKEEPKQVPVSESADVAMSILLKQLAKK